MSKIPFIGDISPITNSEVVSKLTFKNIISSIITVIIFYLIASLAKKMMIKLGKSKVDYDRKDKRMEEKSYNHTSIIYEQLSNIIFYTIILFGVSIVLTRYGIQKETLYAILGSIAIGVGLSSQYILVNIWCGIILLMSYNYKVDDIVTVYVTNLNKVVTGRIVSVNLFYTKLSDVETGNEIVLSNNIMYTQCVSYNESIVYR